MTEPKTAYVTGEQVSKAWDHWLHFHRGVNCDEVMTRFFAYCHSLDQSFVDDPLDWGNGAATYHVAASTSTRVCQAAGPYYNAVFNAYYAKHPWKVRN